MDVRALTGVAVSIALAACVAGPGGTGGGRFEQCKQTSEPEIAALFDGWNAALQTGDAHRVGARYADTAILLPTLSNRPRLTPQDREDYFRHFLEDRPSGRIDMRRIQIGCNDAVDAGLYTFTFARTGAVVAARYTYTYRWDGSRWWITSHHSSVLPEKP